MFQDSKEGQTHSENDGCGEPAHNKPEKWEEEFDRNFKYVFSEKDPIYGAENAQNKNAIKIFISQAITEAVKEERTRIEEKIRLATRYAVRDTWMENKEDGAFLKRKEVISIINNMKNYE